MHAQRRDNPHLGFLLRASSTLVLALTAWWWVLATPMVAVLAQSTEFFINLVLGSDAGLSTGAAGDWNFRVPVDLVASNGSKIRSIEFSLGQEGLLTFTFSLPTYWAIAIATRSTRRNWLRLVWGTITVCAVEQFSLLAYVQLSGMSAGGQWEPSRSALVTYVLTVLSYMIVRVVPYVAPFVVLLALDPELRREMFLWEFDEQRAPKVKERSKLKFRDPRG